MAKSKALTPVAFVADAQFAAKGEDGTRQFAGTAYAGGVITDHPFLDRVVLDIETTKLRTPAPALFNHNGPVGVIKHATLDSKIEVNGALFADLPGDAQKIADMADRGMPWQMSVGIWPGRIEDVRAGAKIKINGQTMSGPLTVFRDNRIREVSFVALGADHQTDARIFTVGGETRAEFINEGEDQMDQAEHDRIVAEMATKHADALRVKDEAFNALKTQHDALTAKFAARQLAEREAKVKALFAETGREYKPEAATVYLTMDDTAFDAVAADLRASKKIDPALMSHTATNGAEDTKSKGSVDEITNAARKFIAEQAKIGVTVDITSAVRHVQKQAAA